MKKYITPELEEIKFTQEDIMDGSGIITAPTQMPEPTASDPFWSPFG